MVGTSLQAARKISVPEPVMTITASSLVARFYSDAMHAWGWRVTVRTSQQGADQTFTCLLHDGKIIDVHPG